MLGLIPDLKEGSPHTQTKSSIIPLNNSSSWHFCDGSIIWPWNSTTFVTELWWSVPSLMSSWWWWLWCKMCLGGKDCWNGIHIIESNIRCSPKDSKNFKKCLHNVHCSTTTGGKEKFKSEKTGRIWHLFPFLLQNCPSKYQKSILKNTFQTNTCTRSSTRRACGWSGALDQNTRRALQYVKAKSSGLTIVIYRRKLPTTLLDV